MIEKISPNKLILFMALFAAVWNSPDNFFSVSVCLFRLFWPIEKSLRVNNIWNFIYFSTLATFYMIWWVFNSCYSFAFLWYSFEHTDFFFKKQKLIFTVVYCWNFMNLAKKNQILITAGFPWKSAWNKIYRNH